jgi:hypothetical protein
VTTRAEDFRVLPGSRSFVSSVTYMGDLVLSLIAVEGLARRRDGGIVLATVRENVPLVRTDPRLAGILAIEPSSARWRIGMLRVVLAARRCRGSVVNLEIYRPRWRFLRSLCAVMGVAASDLDLDAFTRDEARAAAGAPVTLPHRSHYYARAVGIEGSEPPLPHLHLDSAAVERMERRLPSEGKEGGSPLVVVHPGSREDARQAPTALYTRFLRELAARRPVRVVLVGGEADRRRCGLIAGELARWVAIENCAGELPLADLPVLLARASVFVGNDSGPLKVAEAVGARTVSFWGPSSPKFAGPRGPGHHMLRFDVAAAEAATRAVELL